MPSTNDIVSPKGLFALFKGAPNTGKSVAADSFPDVFKFDFDRKMPTVSQKHYPGKMFTWECFDDVFALSDFLKPYMLPTVLGGIAFPHETIVVDTVSSLSTICLRSVDKTKGTSVPEMMKTLTKKENTVEVMGIDYYNSEFNFFERYFMDNLKILWAREGNPKHVIVIAHETTYETSPDLKGNPGKKVSSILTAGRKAAVYIPKCFDEEYVFVKETPTFGDQLSRTKWLCHTKSNLHEDARTCYNFPEVIDLSSEDLYTQLNKVAHWSEVPIPEPTFK